MAKRAVKPKKEDSSKAGPRATRSNHAGWLALLIAASACMFVLGVLVGRNTAPVHFNMETFDNLEPSVLAADTSEPEAEEEPMPEEIPFEFYEELKKQPDMDEYAQGRPRVLAPKYEKPKPSEIRVARAESKPKPRKPAESHSAKPAPEVIKPEVPRQEATPAPKPPEAPRTAPEPETPAETAAAPAPPPPKDGQFAIQVASLRDPERAEALRQKFRSKGYPAFTQVATVEGKGQWCRVRIGPYADRGQAENDLVRLQKAGVDAMVFSMDGDQ